MKRKKIKKIRFRQSLFWDVDPKTIDPKKHAKYIIERILDFGTDGELKWLFGNYSRRLIKNTVIKSRVLHNKSRNLWMQI